MPNKADTLLDLVQKRLKKYFADLGIVSSRLKHAQLAVDLNRCSPQEQKDRAEKIAIALKILQNVETLQQVIISSDIAGTFVSDTSQAMDLILFCIEQSIIAKNNQFFLMAYIEPSEFSLALDDIVKELTLHCKLNNDYHTIVQEKIRSLTPTTTEEQIRVHAKQERDTFRATMANNESCVISPNAHIDHSAELKEIKTSRKKEKKAIEKLYIQQKVLHTFLKALQQPALSNAKASTLFRTTQTRNHYEHVGFRHYGR